MHTILKALPDFIEWGYPGGQLRTRQSVDITPVKSMARFRSAAPMTRFINLTNRRNTKLIGNQCQCAIVRSDEEMSRVRLQNHIFSIAANAGINDVYKHGSDGPIRRCL